MLAPNPASQFCSGDTASSNSLANDFASIRNNDSVDAKCEALSCWKSVNATRAPAYALVEGYEPADWFSPPVLRP